MTLTVPCLFGLESLVADEMRRLNLKNVRAENGRVHCDGTLADIARLNINLRCGARVLMELGSFPARDFEALFQGVCALPWEDYIPRNGEFPVKGYSLNSQLHSVPACQAIVKKASAKRLGEKYGVETLPESGSRYQIQFSIIKDVATLYLDTSGEGLYKRGYRAKNMGAPLRETLAAALVTLSRYRGKDPFCDPFCGSGTIPIEAALIAKNRAPGLDRSFAAQKWKNMDSKLWLEAGDEAMDKEFHGHYDIWGGDIDPAAEGAVGDAVDGHLPVGKFFLCGFQKLPQEGGGGFAGGKGEVTFLLIAVFHGKGGGEFIPQKGGGTDAVAQLVEVLVIAVIRQGQPGDKVELIGAEGDAAAVAAQHLFPEFIGDADAVGGFLGGHHAQGIKALPMAGEPDGY